MLLRGLYDHELAGVETDWFGAIVNPNADGRRPFVEFDDGSYSGGGVNLNHTYGIILNISYNASLLDGLCNGPNSNL